ncbi:MAG: hypothetical protein JJ897_02860 [Marinibacterium sp.]|nr:hypothetical protein [Marinibacterium sp.]
MRFSVFVGLCAALATPVLAAGTDPVVVYPYANIVNYCPAGLQPVTVDGTVICGTPTTIVTYQQAATAVGGYGPAKCRAGTKGC